MDKNLANPTAIETNRENFYQSNYYNIGNTDL